MKTKEQLDKEINKRNQQIASNNREIGALIACKNNLINLWNDFEAYINNYNSKVEQTSCIVNKPNLVNSLLKNYSLSIEAGNYSGINQDIQQALNDIDEKIKSLNQSNEACRIKINKAKHDYLINQNYSKI